MPQSKLQNAREGKLAFDKCNAIYSGWILHRIQFNWSKNYCAVAMEGGGGSPQNFKWVGAVQCSKLWTNFLPNIFILYLHDYVRLNPWGPFSDQTDRILFHNSGKGTWFVFSMIQILLHHTLVECSYANMTFIKKCPQRSPWALLIFLICFVTSHRYSEGVTDVSGSSITMVGVPQPVFTDFQRGLMETK